MPLLKVWLQLVRSSKIVSCLTLSINFNDRREDQIRDQRATLERRRIVSDYMDGIVVALVLSSAFVEDIPRLA